MKQFNLLFILLILVIILIIKLYLESSRSDWLKKNHSVLDTNVSYQNLLNKMRLETDMKINEAIEAGYKEGFQSMNGGMDINSMSGGSGITNNADKIVPYSKFKDATTNTIMLFYKKTCHFCSEFLPTWYRVVNDLPNGVKYEEIECNENVKKAGEYNITGVPTLILLSNDEKKIYMGNRSYDDISRFLKLNGVNIVKRTFEEFDSSGYDTTDNTNPTPTSGNSNCPAVTFDKQLDFAADKYMFQIFNQDGQYGYATGGTKDGSLLSPFNAAYSVLDSYLSSLPDPSDPTKNSYLNVNECANIYSKQIKGFGICDANSLNKIASYDSNIKYGLNTNRVSDTNYSTNKKVVGAIKSACGLK